MLHAYSLALHPVFLYAILVAFILSWFLREVPLLTKLSRALLGEDADRHLIEGPAGSGATED